MDIPAAAHTAEVLLLPHAHAARVWRAEHRHSPAAHRDVLSWSEWTSSLWSRVLLEGTDDRVLLNRLQEQHLWSEILAQQPSAGAVAPASIPELAHLARSGLQRAAAYRVIDRLSATADTSDARLYSQWVDAFLQRCNRDRFLPPALLEEALSDLLRQKRVSVPSAVTLVGFGPRTPAQTHLLQTLETAGTQLTFVDPSGGNGSSTERRATTFGSEAEELRFAVRLIAQQARAGTAHAFGLISPDPQKHRPLLEPLFREVLAPELGSASADLSSTPWFAQTNRTLRSVPVISSAIHLLQWTAQALPIEHIDQLLVSAFFNFGGSPAALARLHRETRRGIQLRPGLTLAEWLAQLRSAGLANAFPALRQLQLEVERARLSMARRSHPDWAEQIRRLLRVAGWPGARVAIPAEFQAVEAWDSLLDRIATLGVHNTRPDFAAVLQLLVAETQQQDLPSLSPEAPVQLVSFAEAEGLRFDLAVVLGASDENLPPMEGRHPFLSQGLQRSLDIGDPARDLARCTDVLDRLARRCVSVYLLASPSSEGAEAQLSPLAAILHFAVVQEHDIMPQEAVRQPVPLDLSPEPTALAPLPTPRVPRGVDVLRLQAACGFRAFSAVRLGAEEPQRGTLGLDARDGGNILHTALQLLWQELGDQQTLRNLSSVDRRALTTKIASEALEKHRLYASAGSDDSWNAQFRSVLQQRFSALLLAWLDQELNRAPFRVLSQEDEQHLDLGRIELSFRRDRVDEVEGGVALVDYKTSSELSCDQWLDQRPDAPQLPAYALALDDPQSLRGIAFAQVRPGAKQAGWISLSDAQGIFPASKANRIVDLEDQLQQWRMELTSLADAFANGEAHVNPKSYPHTCKFCAYRALCRLDPATLLEQASCDDEAVEEEVARG